MLRITANLTFVFICLLAINAIADPLAEDSRFWTYQEFSNIFQDQQKSNKSFAIQVREKGKVFTGTLNKPIRIAVIYPGKQVSDYWRRSISSFEARLKENAIPYAIHPYFSKPGSELRLQEAQIAEALEHDPDYLVFTLDALQHQVIIDRMLALKRPKLILQNITTPLKRWDQHQPFLYVGFDHAEGTKILFEEYIKRFPGKARYAIFYGPKGYVSQMRGGTFKKLSAQHKNLNLIAEYYTGFDREKAYKAAIHLLINQPDLNFIFSSSTDIALGVIDAIKELGRQGQVITNGWGGGSKEIDAIKKADMDFTVMRNNDDNGAAMAEAIMWDIENRAGPTVYSGDITLVTKEMSYDEINKLTTTAFRYSGQLEAKN